MSDQSRTLWRSPGSREKGGGDYSDPAKALARIMSGHQVNLQDQMLSATSSPAPAFGRSPAASQDGPTTDLFGQPVARVSRSASRAKAKASMIQGTCGPTYFDSSEPAGPLSSWENRLRARLATVGSTESALIWKEKVTPAGRSISRLAPWTPPTDDSGSIGSPSEVWATPTAHERTSMPRQVHHGQQLANQIAAQWPTPFGQASAGGRYPTSKAHPGVTIGDILMGRSSVWPTPTVADVEGGRKARSGARGDEMLLNGLLSGETPTGSPAPMGKRGARPSPNPIFAMWLMGFPATLAASILHVCSSKASRGAPKRGGSPETP